MAIQLQKNNGIKLTKEVANVEQALKSIKLGCGWKASNGYYNQTKVVREEKRKGFLGLGGVEVVEREVTTRIPTGNIDIDASVLAYKDGALVGKCYFGNKTMTNGNGKTIAKSSGDNLVGSTGKQDDETITINIDNIGNFADTLYLVLNIFSAKEKKQHFNMVESSWVRVYDDCGKEMARFDLDEDYDQKTGVVVGKLVKVDGQFQFIALGDGLVVKGLTDLSKKVQQF